MKIFLDDDPVRDSWVDDTWTIVRAPHGVLNLIAKSEPGEIEELSLDHDLAYFTHTGEERTGYWLLSVLEKMAHGHEGFIERLPKKFTIHSANPVGRKNMQAAIDSIERMRNR